MTSLCLLCALWHLLGVQFAWIVSLHHAEVPMMSRQYLSLFLFLGSVVGCVDNPEHINPTLRPVGDQRDAPSAPKQDTPTPQLQEDPFAWADDRACLDAVDADAAIGQTCCLAYNDPRRATSEAACAPELACIAGMGHDTPVCVSVSHDRRGGAVCTEDAMCGSDHCDLDAGNGTSVGRCRADINEDCNTNACADGLICILNGPRRTFKCWPEDFRSR